MAIFRNIDLIPGDVCKNFTLNIIGFIGHNRGGTLAARFN